MALSYRIFLAFLLCLAHGRRVQTPAEILKNEAAIESAHTTQSHESGAGHTSDSQSKAYATHLLAQPLPHMQAPAPALSSHQTSIPSTLVDASSPLDPMATQKSYIRLHGAHMDLPSSNAEIDSGSDKDSHTSSPLADALLGQQKAEHMDSLSGSADVDVQGSSRRQGANMKAAEASSTEDDMPASSPFFAVFLNYISLAFASMVRALSPKGKILDRLNRVSNVASILCAIDCTVFPLLLTVLPLVSAVSTGGATAWLHEASHACALWFVGPVGGLAVITNWIQHKKPLVGLWGLSGIAAIILANIHLPHMILGYNFHTIGHLLHEWHTPINVMGCILLLSSQRYAHSLVHCGDCGHNHGHSHSHGHSDDCQQ